MKPTRWFTQLTEKFKVANTSRSPGRGRVLRMFEQLEDRLALSVVPPTITNIPNEITVYAGSSYHYAIMEDYGISVNSASDGLFTEHIKGGTVSITFEKTNTSTGQVSELGTITIQLFEDDAPISTARFLELVNNGLYDGKSLHRIIEGFMFQGGSGISGYSNIKDEYSDFLLHNSPGMVAFANAGTGSSSSQFYVLQDASNWLNGGYNVFGFVISGYDVIDKICDEQVTYNSSTGEYSSPVNTIRMKDVTITAGEHEGIFRIGANANTAPGDYQVSVTVTNPNGTQTDKTITVHVVADLGKSLETAIGTTQYELAAGITKTLVTLPTTIAGKSVTYKVQAYDSFSNNSSLSDGKLPDGVTFTFSNNVLVVTATAAVSQAFVLKVSITTSDNYTDNIYLDVFVTPAAPALTVSQDSFSGTSNEVTTKNTLNFVFDGIYSNADISFFIKKDNGVFEEFSIRQDGILKIINSNILVGPTKVNGLERFVLTLTRETLGEWLGLFGDETLGKYTVYITQTIPFSRVLDGSHADVTKESTRSTITVIASAMNIDYVDMDQYPDYSGSTLRDYYAIAPNGNLQYGVQFQAYLTVNSNETPLTNNPIVWEFKSNVILPYGMAINGNVISWIPDIQSSRDYEKEYHVTVIGRDGAGRYTELEIIFDLAHGPQFLLSLAGETESITGQTIALGSSRTIAVDIDLTKFDDYDPTAAATCSYTITGNAANLTSSGWTLTGQIALVNGKATQTWNVPANLLPGTYFITVTTAVVTGTGDNADTSRRHQTFAFTIQNTPPTITYIPNSITRVTVGTTQTWQFTADNPNSGQTLSWSLESAPTGMAINAQTGKITYTPVTADAGKMITVTVIVSDGIDTDSKTLTVDVVSSGTTPDPDDPDDPDNPWTPTQNVTPLVLPPITSLADLRAAMTAINSWLTQEIQKTTTTLQTALISAHSVATTGVSNIMKSLTDGTYTQLQAVTAIAAAETVRRVAQEKAVYDFLSARYTINQYLSNAVKTITEAGFEAAGIARTEAGKLTVTVSDLRELVSTLKAVSTGALSDIAMTDGV